MHRLIRKHSFLARIADVLLSAHRSRVARAQVHHATLAAAAVDAASASARHEQLERAWHNVATALDDKAQATKAMYPFLHDAER